MKAVVIGGGIIGLCTAYYLRKEGWEVTIVDKSDLSDNCSHGNLGMVVPSHFVPLAAPGMVAQGIRWMFNSRSPFYVKPSLNPSLINWGLKFLKSATVSHVEYSALPLLQINNYSKDLYERMLKEPGFDFAYEKKGILMYYKTEKTGEEEVHMAEKARSMGLDVSALNKKEVQLLEPDLTLDILGAVHYQCDAHLAPQKLMQQLMQHLKSSGVVFETNTSVTSVIKEGNKITKIIAGDKEINGDVFVFANGSWLPQLAKMAGINIPLMPGKGYSITYEQPRQKLNVPAILCEARVAITPMNGKMRYGGTMEIAPVNDQINMNRVQGIIESVSKYFPEIRLAMPEKKDVWFGFRPVSPDGLPYIGYSAKIQNLIIAGGHAMMGLSLGPASGKIVADLANQRKTEINISAFNANRFS
jgi:D-amino-acid dehydrogenase